MVCFFLLRMIEFFEIFTYAEGDMKLSVVIPTLNEKDYLPKLLRSLATQQSEGLEIIVVDASPDDRTRRAAEEPLKAFKHQKFLQAPERNVSVQRNFGAEQARYDTVLFLDADVIIPEDVSLEDIVRRFRKLEAVVATCRFAPSEKHLLGSLFFSHILYRFHQFYARRKRAYALGAFIMADKERFISVGGFDPTIRVNEDAHLVERMKAEGPFVVFSDRVQVSLRRFKEDGFVKTTILYLKLWLYRTLRGELRDDTITYEFGHYTKNKLEP